MLKREQEEHNTCGTSPSASLLSALSFLWLLSASLLVGKNYQITIENSSDLNQWETLFTTTVSSDTDKNFYRAQIQTIEPSLSTTTLEVTQSWSQETDYARLAYVEVPATTQNQYPVLVLLHGFGGSAQGMLKNYSVYSNHIRVALDGYATQNANGEYVRSWNIGYEPSKADDIAFLNAILEEIKRYSNVDTSNITLLGTSNGAALVNKAIIELPIDAFPKAITIATPLIEDQYRDGHFWYDPNQLSNYTTEITPAQVRKLLNFHGTADSVVPYIGGNALGRTFWSAQESSYIFAQAMGYTGNQLTGGIAIANTNLYKYSYLNDTVVHYEAVGDTHGLIQSSLAMQPIIENFID